MRVQEVIIGSYLKRLGLPTGEGSRGLDKNELALLDWRIEEILRHATFFESDRIFSSI
jgi:hypothetical protein